MREQVDAVGYTLTELKLSVHFVSKQVGGIMLAPVKKDKQSDRSHRVLVSSSSVATPPICTCVIVIIKII